MHKKIAFCVGLTVFTMTISDPWRAVFACHGAAARMRQAAMLRMAAAGSGAGPSAQMPSAPPSAPPQNAAAAAPMPSGASSAPVPGGASATSAHSRMFTAYSRKSPMEAWRVIGYFPRYEDAARAMQVLQSQGYESFIK